MRVSVLTLAVVAVAVSFPALAQRADVDCEAGPVVAIGNTELSAELVAPGTEARVSGRMSVYLAASGKDLENGVVRVGGWNVALFSVPQAAISGVDDLAQELGHVIGLHHPREAATANLYPASTGTLLCGSGFNNDKPTINSQENKDNLANPLLQFSIKVRTTGPDCQDDSDCGACP